MKVSEPNTIYFPEEFIFNKENAKNIINFFKKFNKVRYYNLLIDGSKTKSISESDLFLLQAYAEKIAVSIKRENKEVKTSVRLINFNRPLAILIKEYLYSNREFTKKNKNKTLHLSLFDKDLESNDNINFAKDNNPIVVSSIVEELKKIGIKGYDEFYSILVEMIGNAIEHGVKDRHINWWIYKNKDSQKHFTFACLDLGVGILESYRRSKALRIKHKYLTRSSKLLLLALNGDLGSSTLKEGRGTGLKSINKAVRNKWIENFVLITNNVYLEYDSVRGKYKSKKIPNFAGTYYSWTIDKECFNRWKQSQI